MADRPKELQQSLTLQEIRDYRNRPINKLIAPFLSYSEVLFQNKTYKLVRQTWPEVIYYIQRHR